MPSPLELALLSQEIQSRQVQPLQTQKGLLIIGLQNDFTTHDGKLPVSVSDSFWPHLRSLIPAFREFGVVVWIRIESDGTPKDSCIIASSGKVECDGQSENEDDCQKDENHDAEDASEQREECENDEDADDRHSPVPAKRQRRSSDDSDSTPTLDAIEKALTPESSASKSSETIRDEEFFLSKTPSRDACCLRDSDGAKLCPDAASLVDSRLDLQNTTNTYSAFDSRSLLSSLRSKLVTELFICGCPTNSSVYATVMDAAQYGFGINLLEDCLTATSARLRDLTIAQLCDDLEAEAMTSTEALEFLRNPPCEDDEDYESDEQAKYEGEEVDRALGGLRGGGATLIADDDSSESAQSHGDATGDLSPKRASTSSDASHSLKLDKEVEDLRFSSDETPSPLTKGTCAKEECSPTPKSTSVGDYAQGAEVGDSVHSLPTEDHRESECNTTIGEQQLAPHGNSLTRDDLVEDDSLEETDVYQFIKKRWHSRQPPLGSSKHRGLNAVASLCCLPQKTVDQYEDMMRQASTPNLRPLFGEGTEAKSGRSTIMYRLLPSDVAETVFDALNEEITWQRMYHQNGEVPRLVCCQGSIEADGSRPVYRHPSDQTLPIEPWTPMVDRIRKAAEDQIGHSLNHALIQFYRSGTDYISEHSDKTLDITKGTCIVNVSFGAQRTMRLRTKRVQGSDPAQPAAERTTYRVPMPHNSMIKMTLETNAEYLHGINPDKRPAVELSPAEQAYGGGRISLTFRNIGTFLDADSTHIWGQGATGKTRDCARAVVNGDAAESEKLVRAFGAENQATTLQWDATYGGGSDVLHLKAAAAVRPQTT